MITIEKDTPVDVEIIQRSSARAIPGSEDILRQLVSRSSDVWKGLTDGRVGCVWGLIPASILSETAWIWSIYDEEDVKENKFFFVRNSQRFIEYAHTIYPTISGQVDPRDRMSVKWLKWLGAEFDPVFNGRMGFVIRKK